VGVPFDFFGKEISSFRTQGFFGYLKRKLASKGGVQRKYLHLFLGEYVWRYNYRQLTVNQRVNRLMKLLEDFSG